MTIELRENERIDDLQRNQLKIIQNPDKFCFGMDAVLLSGFARIFSPAGIPFVLERHQVFLRPYGIPAKKSLAQNCIALQKEEFFFKRRQKATVMLTHTVAF